MNLLRIKSVMLCIIYTASIFLLSIAYYAHFSEEYNPAKDSRVLSDYYIIVDFDGEKPTIEQLNEWASKQNCRYVMTKNMSSQSRTVAFSTQFMKDMKISPSCLEGVASNEDVAIVNEDALEMCYKIEDELWLNRLGTEYKVIATYEDCQDDVSQEVFYYLNQNAKSLQKDVVYDTALIDPRFGVSMDALEQNIVDTFLDVSVSRWSNTQETVLHMGPLGTEIEMLFAVLVCLGSIALTKKWIETQQQEFEIRCLVGATEGQNRLLLLKRLGFLLLLALCCGLGLSYLVRSLR